MTRTLSILAAVHASNVAAATWSAWLEGIPMSWLPDRAEVTPT